MTMRKLRIVNDFFRVRDEEIDDVVALAFGYTFELAPEARALFKGEIKDHRALFAKMFREIIKLTRTSYLWPVSAQTGNILLPGLSCLRSRHAGAGVKFEHFGVMKAALLKALEESFHGDFSPEVRDAFVFVFEVLTQSLTNARHADTEVEPLKRFSRHEHKVESQTHDFNQFLFALPAD